MNITVLDPSFLKDTCRLINCCRLDLHQRNIDQWDDEYPSESLLASDLNAAAAFGLFEDEKLVGYLVADETCVAEYASVPWTRRNDRALMLHRLCVNPAYQNRGFAKALLLRAEERAKDDGFGSIRLDVFDKNKIIRFLVESLDYEYRSDIALRKGTFRCYEKAILPVI